MPLKSRFESLNPPAGKDEPGAWRGGPPWRRIGRGGVAGSGGWRSEPDAGTGRCSAGLPATGFLKCRQILGVGTA